MYTINSQWVQVMIELSFLILPVTHRVPQKDIALASHRASAGRTQARRTQPS